MRGVSTVLDATLCLLLVSASALVLAGTPDANGTVRDRRVAAESADETAAVLATSTARITYPVGDRNRTAHDTLAGLLASATSVDSRDGGSDSAASAFRKAVVDRVGRELRRIGAEVQVVVRPSSTGEPRATRSLTSHSPSNYSPTNHSPTRDESAYRGLVAGETPPPDGDVHAADFAVRGARFTVRTWSA